MMQSEPVRIIALVNAAIAATLGILTITEVLDPEIAGAIGVALAAWIAVAAEFIVRPRVASPLTQENLQKELAEAKAAGV